ncbi:MAG: 3-phosphoshikimate 1-carboxyvinyltransferase [Candidatus Omnitrophica bacterium]|nr:3-phosphoshikimate 1-carboxyvinyltransferase [Candidatus Omnitrophota bacterium]
MRSIKIKPIKKLSGNLRLAGDKSISHRAVMIGAIAEGVTRVKNILDCDDCNYTIEAFRRMGVSIRNVKNETIITGSGLKGLKKPSVAKIFVGNSGTTMRILAGILAGQDFETSLEGDTSLSNRPMMRITEPLSQMGVDIRASTGGYPPLKIKGGLVNPIDYRMPIPSAQVKSAILFAGLYAKGTTSVEEAFKSRDHTERMLKLFGSKIKVDGLKISVEGGVELEGRSFDIPGDISSASFFMAGGVLLNDSKIRIERVSINPTRAGILKIMSGMGADIRIHNKADLFEPAGDVEVETSRTKGIVIGESEIPGIIDELPIIFVLAALSKGRTVIRGAEELRVKETDRINSMKANLEKMGADIEITKNEIVINGVKELKGSKNLRSFGDHRTCMAMTIAALAAKGESEIDDIDCVNKSFPEFFNYLKKLEG